MPAGFLAALKAPVVFLVLLVLFLGAAAWLVPKLFRALRRLLGKLANGAGATVRRSSGTGPEKSGPSPQGRRKSASCPARENA